MINITKEPFSVVYKYDTNVFGVVENVLVTYDDSTTVDLDDRIRRIDMGIYLGSLIQNPEMMVYQPGKEKDDLKKLLADYFSAYDPVIIRHKPMGNAVSTFWITTHVFRSEPVITEYDKIFSDKEVTSHFRVVNDDFSIIGIKDYTVISDISGAQLLKLEFDKIYRYTGRGNFQILPYDDGEVITLSMESNGAFITFTVGEKYFGPYEKSTYCCHGPQEYTIFFEIKMIDTDSTCIICHLGLHESKLDKKHKHFYNDIPMDEIIPNIHNIARALSSISQKTGLDRISFNIETEKCVKFRDDGYTYIPVPIRNYDCDEVDYFHVDVVNTGYDPSNKLRCDIEIYPYSLENDTILNDRAEITIEGVDEERLKRFLNPETFIDELISSAPKYFALEDGNNE